MPEALKNTGSQDKKLTKSKTKIFGLVMIKMVIMIIKMKMMIMVMMMITKINFRGLLD